LTAERSGHTEPPGIDAFPGVSLAIVSRPSFDRAALEELLDAQDLSWSSDEAATEAENLIEVAGRVCYLSFGERQSPKSNREYIRHLIVHGHESVLEHASWTFLLTGVSRGFSHQLVRHRVGFAFSQLSQQYVDHGAAEIVMPEVIKDDPLVADLWQAAIDSSFESYRALLAALESSPTDLAPRERLRLRRTAARSVLPAAVETKIAFSANARAIRHFLATRGGVEGDEEMRIVSAALFAAVRSEAPSVFEDFSVEQLSDGLPVIRQGPRQG
jgi:thymidylate synthase (FAD)